MKASALDIGGTRARIYEFEHDLVVSQTEIWLPQREDQEELDRWGTRRIEAITGLVASWKGSVPHGRLPTACAGRKDAERESVVLSTYASPLIGLVSVVREHTGIDLGPLYDDDVCAGWGHLVSPQGGLERESPGTILLTSGTGLAECLWLDGRFLAKGTYPRLADLGLEDPLRAEGWREGDLPMSALDSVCQARRQLGEFRRVVLAGRFAGRRGWPSQLASGTELRVCGLDEAPALGALALSRE